MLHAVCCTLCVVCCTLRAAHCVAACTQTVEDARSAKVVDIVIKLDAARNQRACAIARYTVNETTLQIQVP